MDDTPKRKRVFYVITKASWGGAQRYVYDLACHMQREGHDVAVLYGVPGDLVPKLEAAGVRTMAVPSLSRDIHIKEEFRAFRELCVLLKSEQPDILHVNSSKAGLALVAARLVRVPRTIFTAHGWAFNEVRPWFERLLLRGIYALTIYLSHVTICVSDAVRHDIRWLPFTKKRLVVIKNGIDTPTFLGKDEARQKLAPNVTKHTWLGMIGELHASKRTEDAIRAVSELIPDYPDLVLVICGEGEERAKLELLIERRNLKDHVILAGFVDHASQYLRAFDIFLMPSRTEALGYALIEAGFAGLPVIASRIGGMKEIVRHKVTGLLVPPHNPHVLVRALRTLLEDAAFAGTLGDALRTTTMVTYQKERMVTATVALYGD